MAEPAPGRRAGECGRPSGRIRGRAVRLPRRCTRSDPGSSQRHDDVLAGQIRNHTVKFKKLAVGVAAVGLAFSLAACSGGRGSTTAASGSTSNKGALVGVAMPTKVSE